MAERVQASFAIVGAGPAGMAAARTATKLGARVLVLDENPRPGGQIYRQPPESFDVPHNRFEAPSHAAGHRLLKDSKAVDVWTGVTVWDAQDKRLHVMREGHNLDVHFEKLILATGAQDRSIPFPGWTLPGVITAGAAQVLVRGQAVVPGNRAVIAGTGPLLLPTVTALLRAGVEVAAIFEANPRHRLLRTLPGVMTHKKRCREAWHYLRHLFGKRLRTRHAVFAAHGDRRIERVVYGKLDKQGRPVGGSEKELEADLLCVGFGLQPNIELGLRLGCGPRFDQVRGGWAIDHDENMQTSVEGVYVAGEIAGVGGAEVAMAQGELAALAATGSQGPLLAARRAAERERRAADKLLRAFPVPAGLYELANHDTIVCRCEDVSYGELASAARLFGSDLRGVKMATRAGMGPCQARICHMPIGELLCHRLGGQQPVPCPKVQMPVKPVAVEAILERSP